MSGLIKKRAEIVGLINECRERTDMMLSQLDALDQVIRVFDPYIDFEDMPVKRVAPPHVAFRGEITRFLLDVLRQAKKPLSTHELGIIVMDQRRLNTADKILCRTISARTGNVLRKMRDKGMCDAYRASRGLLMWRIADAAKLSVTR